MGIGNKKARFGVLRVFPVLLSLVFCLPAYASFNDCAIDWNLFQSNPGYIAGYTYKGNLIRDAQATGSGDSSHGQANVPPASTDLASAATAGTNPGPATTPFFGYYDGGTRYDPNDPSTMNDDVLFFRIRISGDPRAGGGKEDFDSYHWNILLDVDADGYKEYWIDLDGSWSQRNAGGYYDRLQILYNNDNTQIISQPDAAGVRVGVFTARNAADPGICTYGRSHTRAYAVGDGSPDWYIEYQIPMTAFKDSMGNQVLYPDSPVAFVFSTGASNQNPLQKDWMMDLNYLTDADPITFGDIVYPNGKPFVWFVNSSLDRVGSYAIGDNVYLYVSDRFANTDNTTTQTIQVTVSDPSTGDDEVVTLYETAPSSGIFTNTVLSGVPLPTTASDGAFNNSDGNGTLEVSSGNTVYVSYTSSSSLTVTDQAAIVDPCEAFIQFTRANGLPTASFILTNDPSTSDRFYVTVTNPSANTNPASQQTISISLTGSLPGGLDSQTLTLTETGNNTGVFRNTTGLQTKISDSTVTPNDNLWEDVDGGAVTVSYSYTCGGNPYTRTASAGIFVTPAGGRVYFTNSAGTQDVELYAPGQNVYLKVVDATYTCGGSLTVTVASPTGDSELITLTQTAPGSGVYMNTGSPLVTATSSGSYTPNNGTITAADGDILTVTYHDCNDGDGYAGNDDKTDTALYNAPSIVINEVLFYPDPNTCQTEYIQLYNSSSQPVNVTGFRVTNEDSFSYTIPQLNGSNILLGAGKKLYISIYDVVPPDYYDSATGTYFLFAQAVNPVSYPSNELKDQEDQVSLYNASSVIIDYVAWSATTTPSVSFISGNYAAVRRGIWQDGAFKNTATMPVGSAITRTALGIDTNTPADWGYNSSATICQAIIITVAVISSFDAYEDNGQMVVKWETASEVNTVGFYLLRLDKETGKFRQINKRLLPGLINSKQGGTYRLIDHGASLSEGATYKLVEVESRGNQWTYGPFSVGADIKPGTLKSLQKDNNAVLHKPEVLSGGSVSHYRREAHGVSQTQENRVEARKGAQQAFKALRGSRVAQQAKISVTEPGLYHLKASEISAVLGMPEQRVRNMIRQTSFSLSNRGKKVAYLADNSSSGIYFYGQGMDSIYTRKNIYWLTSGSGLEMVHAEGRGPLPAAANETYGESLHFEEDLIDAPGLFKDPMADYWFWDYVFAGDPDMGSRSFTLRVNGIAPNAGTASLAIRLRGGSDSWVENEHHAMFTLNGTKIGETLWQGTDEGHAVTLSFSQDLLIDGDNTIAVSGSLDSGAPYSIFYINSFDLAYQRFYQAVGNALLFRGDTNQVVSVSGFTNSDILVFEVTDALSPKAIKAITIDGTGGNYRVSLKPASPEAVYLAISRDAAKAGAEVWADVPSGLKDKNNRADYLVIASSGLKNTAASLAAYRTGRGLSTMVVDLEDIMDEYNHGIYRPEAIRDFLSYAYKNWKRAPKYVVLAGDGSYDYKDNLGFGDSLISPMMVLTPDGLFPSDNYFVADGNHVPIMAIGRLPASTPQELQGMIEKIITFEAASNGALGSRIVMLADMGEGGLFTAQSDQVAAVLPATFTPIRIYLEQHSVDEARWLLFNELNKGVGVMNYIGHGGLDRLSGSGFLMSDDIASMTNTGRYPVVTAMTCVVGQFSIPGYASLAEYLVLKQLGGAVAMWSPTGISVDSVALILNSKFFQHAFKEGKHVLGDVIVKALQAYAQEGNNDPSMMDIYTLLGDPALKIGGN